MVQAKRLLRVVREDVQDDEGDDEERRDQRPDDPGLREQAIVAHHRPPPDDSPRSVAREYCRSRGDSGGAIPLTEPRHRAGAGPRVFRTVPDRDRSPLQRPNGTGRWRSMGTRFRTSVCRCQRRVQPRIDRVAEPRGVAGGPGFADPTEAHDDVQSDDPRVAGRVLSGLCVRVLFIIAAVIVVMLVLTAIFGVQQLGPSLEIVPDPASGLGLPF